MSDFTGPGVYQFCCEYAPNMVLHLPGASTANGTQVTIWNRNAIADHLSWVMADAGNNEWLILNARTGGYMTSGTGNSNSERITVNLISAKDKRARWKLVPAYNGSGTYYLESVASPGMVVNVAGSATANDSGVIQYRKGNDSNARFYLRVPATSSGSSDVRALL